MIAVVSERGAVLRRLTNAFVRVSRPNDVTPYPSLTAFLAATAQPSLVVVDLAGLSEAPDDVLADLSTWCAVHPGVTLATFFTGNGEREEHERMRLLVRELDAQVISGASLDLEFLRELVANAQLGTARLHREVRERLMLAVARTGRKLQSERPILMFLDLAPENPSVQRVAMGIERAAQPSSRVSLARRLRRDRTLLASDILLLMKVVWWAHLREEGWDHARIAEFLHTTPRNWRKHVTDRLGLSARILEGLPADVFFDWVAQLCAAPHPQPPSPRTLIATLATLAERIRDRINHALLDELFQAAGVARAAPRNHEPPRQSPPHGVKVH